MLRPFFSSPIRRFLPRADKHVDEKVVQRGDAFGLSPPDFEDHIAFFDRLLRFPPREGMLKTVDGRTAGQRPVLLAWIDSGNRLEQRIAGQQLSVVAVRIAGENLINLLRENSLSRMHDKLLGAWVGQPACRFGENPQLLVEFPNSAATRRH